MLTKILSVLRLAFLIVLPATTCIGGEGSIEGKGNKLTSEEMHAITPASA